MNKIIDELKLRGYQKKIFVVPLKRNNSKGGENIQLKLLLDQETKF